MPKNGWHTVVIAPTHLELRGRRCDEQWMNVLSSLVLAALLAVSVSARADADGSDVGKPLELDLGVYLHPGFGKICHRAASDVSECTHQWSAGALAAARWRFSEHASLGGFVGLLWSDNLDYASMHTRLAAQLRWLPYGSGALGLWLGPDAGLAHVVDSVRANELGGAQSQVTVAPAFGLGTGIGIPITDWLQFAVMLRGYVDVFGSLDYRFSRKPERETQAGVGLALSLTLLQ
jgi:hypothetical protein